MAQSAPESRAGVDDGGVLTTFDQVHGALLGVMLGDALGAPVESMTATEISAATGGAGITGFVAPLQTRITDTAHLRPGETTDDWELCRAVAHGLLAAGGRFDFRQMALAHVKARQTRRVGWGGTTDAAVAELQAYFDTLTGRRPNEPAHHSNPDFGGGNAPALKVMPLAVVHAARGSEDQALWSDVRKLALMTHTHPEAVWCAYALAHIARALLTGAGVRSVQQATALVAQAVASIRNLSEFEALDPSRTVEQLRVVIDSAGHSDQLRARLNPGFSAIESVPFALATWASSPAAFEQTVLAAVNSGGDADSTASMAGGLCGANIGANALPSAWVAFQPEYTEARDLAEQLLANR